MTTDLKLPENPADMYKYDYKVIKLIREKLKPLNLWTPDFDFMKLAAKFKKYIGISADDLIDVLTESELSEFIQFQEKDSQQKELIIDNSDVIIECHNLTVKDEYRPLFIDNDIFIRDCLFRVYVPRARG